jgi:hypothetical protein
MKHEGAPKSDSIFCGPQLNKMSLLRWRYECYSAMLRIAFVVAFFVRLIKEGMSD